MPRKSKPKKSYTVSGVMLLSETFQARSKRSAIDLFVRKWGIQPNRVNGRKEEPK